METYLESKIFKVCSKILQHLIMPNKTKDIKGIPKNEHINSFKIPRANTFTPSKDAQNLQKFKRDHIRVKIKT